MYMYLSIFAYTCAWLQFRFYIIKIRLLSIYNSSHFIRQTLLQWKRVPIRGKRGVLSLGGKPNKRETTVHPSFTTFKGMENGWCFTSSKCTWENTFLKRVSISLLQALHPLCILYKWLFLWGFYFRYLQEYNKFVKIKNCGRAVFVLSPQCCMRGGEATNSNFIIFGLTRSGSYPQSTAPYRAH